MKNRFVNISTGNSTNFKHIKALVVLLRHITTLKNGHVLIKMSEPYMYKSKLKRFFIYIIRLMKPYQKINMLGYIYVTRHYSGNRIMRFFIGLALITFQMPYWLTRKNGHLGRTGQRTFTIPRPPSFPHHTMSNTPVGTEHTLSPGAYFVATISYYRYQQRWAFEVKCI